MQIFVSYKLADPGTIAITRSGLIFITAFVMVTTLRTKISTVQWVAIAIQVSFEESIAMTPLMLPI